MQAATPLFSSVNQNLAGAQPARFLPTSRAEMDALGWERCDIIIVTGDAYVDHPSFGMAIIGRVLEASGFKVGIIAQPDWHGTGDFEALGQPRLFFGVTGGNMDSMVNRYTSDRRVRSDDAYTPGGQGGKRPDRCVIVYSQRIREAYKAIPIVIGGIEASLRRIAHFDYWSEQVRRSVLVDSKADLLVYGNAERQIAAIAQRLDAGEALSDIADLRGTAFLRRGMPAGWVEIDSSELDAPGPLNPPVDPYASEEERRAAAVPAAARRRCARCARCCASTRARRKGRQVLPQSAECAARAQRHPPAFLRTGEPGRRAVRACIAHIAFGIESRKCACPGAAPRYAGAVAESAADSVEHGRHGCNL